MTRTRNAFTLVELLVVMVVIAILVGLILSTAGYIQRKAAYSRAQAEVQTLSAAIDNYKNDNGAYPEDSVSNPGPNNHGYTDTLNAQTMGDPVDIPNDATAYQNASLYLYMMLTTDTNCTGQVATGSTKYYFPIKPEMCGRSNPTQPISASNLVTYLQDPYGYSYGYSTIQAYTVRTSGTASALPGYNPTFDLWSTAGSTIEPTPGKSTDSTQKWIKNW